MSLKVLFDGFYISIIEFLEMKMIDLDDKEVAVLTEEREPQIKQGFKIAKTKFDVPKAMVRTNPVRSTRSTNTMNSLSRLLYILRSSLRWSTSLTA